MIPLQSKFCDWLVDVVQQEKIDCVLVAGDLFDRVNPKDDAVALLDDVLYRLSTTGASMVLISGNHDSAERLHFGTRFMSGNGLHIRTERRMAVDIATPVTVTGRDGNEVEILPLPYLDPERVVMDAGATKSHENILRAVLEHKKSLLKNPGRAIAMAHAFVNGGKESDSERKLSIGGTGAVSLDLFEDFAYVALGHLHRPQEFDSGRVIYSGTPMPYSFSEDHPKSVRVITVEDNGITSTTIPSTTGRKVVTLDGHLEDLLSSTRYSKHESSFIRARITDSHFQVGVMDRLRQRFPFILEMEQLSITQQHLLDADRLQELSKRSEEAVVKEYVDETWPDGLSGFGLGLINDALKNAMKEEV